MKKILVAYDGDEPARRALDAAADLAQAFEAELAVISVTPWQRDRFPVDIWDDAGSHEKALAAAAAALRERGLSADLLAPSGDPAATIEEVARAGGYDTIVVGSRDLGPVRRLIEGSVSERVATSAEATVVIAR
jgi:nucleotide-binding universal stress UspA family protein